MVITLFINQLLLMFNITYYLFLIVYCLFTLKYINSIITHTVQIFVLGSLGSSVVKLAAR